MKENNKNKNGMDETENGQKIEKINKVKSWVFEESNKVDKPQARIVKKNISAQIIYIRNEKGDITINPTNTAGQSANIINNFRPTNSTT